MFIRDRKEYSQLITDPYYCKDPKLYEIFKKCLPPKEAYYFFHKPEDILIIDKKKPENSIRRIFTNVPFTDFEKKWLKDLQKIIDANDDLNIPMGWDDGMSLGCIYSALGDIEFAFEIMKDYINWFESTFPMKIVPKDKSWELLNNGFLYIYGRDHQFRPIMVCQPYILQEKLDYFSNSDIVNVCLFVCQFAVNNLLIPGQIENWIMFFNLKGTSLLSLPEPIKQLVQELSDNFNYRLYKCYVLGMSLIMRILYKFVSNFIGQPNEDKMIILDGKKDKHLFDDFNPDNLEKRFGGRAENLVYGGENSLFPPRVPTDNIFFPNENPKNILISEEEYINRCKKGLIPRQSISPYILDKLNEEIKLNEIKVDNNNTNNNIIVNTNDININIKNEEININNIAPSVNSKNNNKVLNNKWNTTKKYIKSRKNSNYSIIKTNINNEKKKIIKNFLSSTDWKIGDEFIEDKLYRKINSFQFNKDFNNFSYKKNKFIKSIMHIK